MQSCLYGEASMGEKRTSRPFVPHDKNRSGGIIPLLAEESSKHKPFLGPTWDNKAIRTRKNR
jgi:hypothetical protein